MKEKLLFNIDTEENLMFKKAQRKAAKLRLALVGPSGSGKTYSALMIAKGLEGRVALIDTERGSGELYSHLLNYDAAQLDPPFSPEKYINAIKAAEQAGYDIVILDSLSHAWTGEGGVLDMHDRASKSVRNTFAAWREVTPQHNALVDAILGSTCHVIVTMRTKTAYEVTNENGKTKVAKVGLAPVQRDGVEYEFTVVMDLSVDGHVGTASKDRTGLFDGQHILPSEETGKSLKRWLEGDVSIVKTVQAESKPPAFKNAAGSFVLDRLYKVLQDLDLIDRLGDYNKYVCNRYDADDLESLPKEHVIEQLNLLQQCKGKPDHLKKLISILNQQQEAA
ncbi:MAG: ATP-binding protein [Saprospiraceae bacterium]|nr:ATP-binding protein [Saprospiraceae bacterium]